MLFEPRVNISDLQNSVRRHNVGLAAVFILPAIRRGFTARVVSRLRVLRGQLVGRPVAWAGELSGGFPGRGDPALDSVKQFSEDGAKNREAAGDYYNVYLETGERCE